MFQLKLPLLKSKNEYFLKHEKLPVLFCRLTLWSQYQTSPY